MIDDETRLLLRNLGWFARGYAGVTIPDGVRFARGTGLSESRAIAILRFLHAAGHVVFDVDRRVTLSEKGARWHMTNRHFASTRAQRMFTESWLGKVPRAYYRRDVLPQSVL